MLKALGAEIDAHAGRRRNAGARSARPTNCVPRTRIISMPQQFKNPANPEIHRKTTAEEIWRDTGRASRYRRQPAWARAARSRACGEVLKKRKPGVKMIAVEPANSPVITQKRRRRAAQAGPAHDPRHRRRLHSRRAESLAIIDDVVQVQDEDATETTRRLAKLEGLMCGISCGAAAWAAIEVAKRAREPRQADRRRSCRIWASGICRPSCFRSERGGRRRRGQRVCREMWVASQEPSIVNLWSPSSFHPPPSPFPLPPSSRKKQAARSTFDRAA